MDESGRKHIPIDQMEFFKNIESASDEIWKEVDKWDWFQKRSVGIQLTESFDSVGANLTEGDGRKGTPDSVRFFRYARASAQESSYWLRRAMNRKLIDSDLATHLLDVLDHSSRATSKIIAYREQKKAVGQVRENRAFYGSEEVSDQMDRSVLDRVPRTAHREPRTEKQEVMEDTI